MRPKQHETRGSGDLFRARLDQIINMRHELAQLAGKIDWDFIDGEITPLYSDIVQRAGAYEKPARSSIAKTQQRQGRIILI
jgi:hypothetical protein